MVDDGGGWGRTPNAETSHDTLFPLLYCNVDVVLRPPTRLQMVVVLYLPNSGVQAYCEFVSEVRVRQ